MVSFLNVFRFKEFNSFWEDEKDRVVSDEAELPQQHPECLKGILTGKILMTGKHEHLSSSNGLRT